MDVAKSVGARIRACREQAGLTQAELAAAAFVTRRPWAHAFVHAASRRD